MKFITSCLILIAACALTACGESETDRVDRLWDEGQDAFVDGRFQESVDAFSLLLELDPENIGAYANRGNAYDMLGEYEKAIADYEALLSHVPNKDDPRLAEVYYNRGYTHSRHNKPKLALVDYHRAIELMPDITDAHNHVAWILATSADASVRDGDQAVVYATEASKRAQGKDPQVLDTLAAAYAEAGRFDDAVKSQQQAMALPIAPETKEAFEARLKLYEQGKPYRE